MTLAFGSDNQSGASPRILEALARANEGHAHGYGADAWTEAATARLRAVFQCPLEVAFVPTGTAANGLALACLTRPWETILCHAVSHLILDESTGPEAFTGGARLVPLGAGTGRLTPAQLAEYFGSAGTDRPHNPQAAVLSLAQVSENGLVYSPEDLKVLAGEAHARGLRVHMDGARFANAVAALGCAPADLTQKAGIDVLTLGATKNGALGAEAVIVFDPTLMEPLVHSRKRFGHLMSKGRYLAAQFLAWLEEDHWLQLAAHANTQARILAEGLASVPGVRLAWPTEANEVFAVIPTALAERFTAHHVEAYAWYPQALPAGLTLGPDQAFWRFVTAWDTADEAVQALIALARA